MSKEQLDSKPPIFSSWKRWYLFVLGFQAFLIILFYLFTQAYQ